MKLIKSLKTEVAELANHDEWIDNYNISLRLLSLLCLHLEWGRIWAVHAQCGKWEWDEIEKMVSSM